MPAEADDDDPAAALHDDDAATDDDDAPIVSLRLHDHYSGVFKHNRRTYHLYDSCYLVNDGPLQHYDESYDLDNYSPYDHDGEHEPDLPRHPDL